MDKLHKHQKEILMRLLFKPFSSFTNLNIEGLSSDHLTYHVKSLIDLGYVEKSADGKYVLTIKGKEYANTYDTDNKVVEKQPKYAVFLVAKKVENGKEFLLIQQRLKEPYFGYQGFITGKVKFGEKLEEAAKRELMEETGLTGDFHFKGAHRDIVYSKGDKTLLEDKVFHIFVVNNCSGDLLENVEGGRNYWLAEESFEDLDKKYYNEDDLYKLSKRKGLFYKETDYYVDVF
jgi:8-oxo-dGTP pyrophosphatase MutT (NUDIX family)